MTIVVGIDIGGTYTVLVLREESTGAVRVAKVLSTPADLSQGLIDGLRAFGIALCQIGLIVHGTTVATNAVLERNGARCGLIMTEGFRDALELRRRARPRRQDHDRSARRRHALCLPPPHQGRQRAPAPRHHPATENPRRWGLRRPPGSRRGRGAGRCAQRVRLAAKRPRTIRRRHHRRGPSRRRSHHRTAPGYSKVCGVGETPPPATSFFSASAWPG
ncbi:MAG: hypothetical protein IID61_17735 [SAR324 cluster bacterium]|nr:hypothetical protein [SAR324 cluster bacterium]